MFTFRNSLKETTENIKFFSPTTANEVESAIKELQHKKPTGSNSTPSKILKMTKTFSLRALEGQGAKGACPSPSPLTFWLLFLFIIKDNEKKLKKLKFWKLRSSIAYIKSLIKYNKQHIT